MFSSLRYRLLAWMLTFVLLIVLLIVPANVLHDRKEKKIGQVVLSLDALYINFLKDSKAVNDFLFVEPVNANFFVTGESPYLINHLTISKKIEQQLIDLKDVRQVQQNEIRQDLSILSDNIQLYNQLFDSLIYLVYKRGYKDYGLEGELYTYGTMLENSPDVNSSAVAGIRKSESIYLSKDDPEARKTFLAQISALKKSIGDDISISGNRKDQLVDLINSYQHAFDRIVRLDEQTGIRRNIALKAELNRISSDVEHALQSIVEESTLIQKSLLSQLNILYLLVLLLIIGFAVYLSYRLSKYTVAHLETLTLYISRLSGDPANVVPSIELRNPTREILQIYHEFRNLVAQLKIREGQRDKALIDAEESMKRYRELADMLPQSIFETDAWGNYTYVNKAWFKQFAYSEEDLDEGLNLIETLISESKENDILAISKIENSNFIGIRKDGSHFPASVYSDHIMIDGRIEGRRGLIVDITDKIEYIHSLQKETTKAKTSDELKSSFLANMSHEIRTPINSIIGFSNLLAMEQIPDVQKKEFIDYIRSSSEILLNLIDDIIDLAKIEAGELKINKKEIELRVFGNELIKTLEESKKKLNKKHVKLVFRPQDNYSTLMLKTDPFRLRQILTNLINNAIKFTEKGSVEFGYSLQHDKSIEFYVKDTGIGLSRNELDLVFERFKRASYSESRNISGTGLGLAISKNLVELLGGQMWVDSEPEKGTVFTFTLPYLRSPQVQSITESVQYQQKEFYDWGGKRILIAEDDAGSYRFLQELLSKTHASILHAWSGAEAVEICRKRHDIDLVIMDIQLPGMNGIEATKHIKGMHASMPVIAQTAHAMAGDRERIRNAGCDDYIAKPIDINKFLSVVNHFLANKDEGIISPVDSSSAKKVNGQHHLN